MDERSMNPIFGVNNLFLAAASAAFEQSHYLYSHSTYSLCSKDAHGNVDHDCGVDVEITMFSHDDSKSDESLKNSKMCSGVQKQINVVRGYVLVVVVLERTNVPERDYQIRMHYTYCHLHSLL